MSDEPLYVDPERLAAHARPYESASHDWARLKSRVTDIRARYTGVWGDDDLGQQFGPSFSEGLDSVEGRVNVVSTTLGYYGEGLVENGKIYGDAREDADQSTYLLLVDSEMVGGYEAPADPNAPARRFMTTEGATYAPVEGTERPLLRRGMTVQGRILTPDEEGEVTPLKPMLASRRLAVEGETYEPDEEVQGTPRLLARGKLTPLEPTHVFYRSVHPATPAIPAVPAEEPE